MPNLTPFNGYPIQACTLSRPERYRELFKINNPMIARGLGKSYGDAALNENGQVVLTERLNRFIDFDLEQGLLTAETGVSLAEILNLIIPKGWFLPVTPGTQQITLGGCIAADVHGKNHHHVGSFGNYVEWLDLITADGSVQRCSPQNNVDLFWATVAGFGLTGIIGTACIKLQAITSSQMTVTHKSTPDLMQTLAILADKNLDDDYSVAWLDVLAPAKNFGRGILMTAHHSNQTELPDSLAAATAKHRTFKVPLHAPTWLLNPTIGKLFNEIYYNLQKKKNKPLNISYQDYFYPLDKIHHWNRLYGKRGFLQYQCVIPMATAEQGLVKLLDHLRHSSYPAFLGVLKRFGKQSKGFLSFPLPGLTLAVDLPIINNEIFKILNQLDEIVVTHGGRVYLAKDARLSAETFRAMYPEYGKFQAIKNKVDPENYFSSSLSRRLALT